MTRLRVFPGVWGATVPVNPPAASRCQSRHGGLCIATAAGAVAVSAWQQFAEKRLLSCRTCRGTRRFWPSPPSVLSFCRETREFTSSSGEFPPRRHPRCPARSERRRPARVCSLGCEMHAVLRGRGRECPTSPQGARGMLG